MSAAINGMGLTQTVFDSTISQVVAGIQAAAASWGGLFSMGKLETIDSERVMKFLIYTR